MPNGEAHPALAGKKKQDTWCPWASLSFSQSLHSNDEEEEFVVCVLKGLRGT